MQFTKFGQTGLTVSRMILGTGTFGKQTDEKEAHRMLDKAAGAGINFIDTADSLGAGESCHYFGHSWRKPCRAADRYPGRRGLQTRQHIENEVGRSQHRIPQGRRRKVRKRWR